MRNYRGMENHMKLFSLYSFGNLVSEEKLEDRAHEIHVTITGLSIMAVYCGVSAFAGIWTGRNERNSLAHNQSNQRRSNLDQLVTIEKEKKMDCEEMHVL